MAASMKTSTSLRERRGQQIDLAWRWKGRADTGWFYPRDMETRHLFYTLRMIWNNFMPPHMRVGLVNLYSFGSTYTHEYMERAVINIGRELFSRTDITRAWQREIDQMRAWFDRIYCDDGLLLDSPKTLIATSPTNPGSAPDAGATSGGARP